MPTANRVFFTTAEANDGTQGVYYIEPATGQDTLLVVLRGGGFAYNHLPAAYDLSKYNMKTRGTGLKSSSGAAATLDIAADLGGLYSDNPAISPLSAARRLSVNYVYSDLWSGTGQRNYFDASLSSSTYRFHGRLAIEELVGVIKALPEVLDGSLTRLVFTGISAGGVGVLSNWQYIYDELKFYFSSIYGISDSGYYTITPPFNGLTPYSGQQLAIARNFWSTPENIHQIASATLSLLSDEAAKRLFVMTGLIDTAAVILLGVDDDPIDFSVAPELKRWCLNVFAAQVKEELKSTTDVHVWAPFDLAHVFCTSTDFTSSYNTTNSTPKEAVTAFLDITDFNNDYTRIFDLQENYF